MAKVGRGSACAAGGTCERQRMHVLLFVLLCSHNYGTAPPPVGQAVWHAAQLRPRPHHHHRCLRRPAGTAQAVHRGAPARGLDPAARRRAPRRAGRVGLLVAGIQLQRTPLPCWRGSANEPAALHRQCRPACRLSMLADQLPTAGIGPDKSALYRIGGRLFTCQRPHPLPPKWSDFAKCEWKQSRY